MQATLSVLPSASKGNLCQTLIYHRGSTNVRHQDYSNSGYDRGHMVRSEERTASRGTMTRRSTPTNLLPQYHDLNAGPGCALRSFANIYRSAKIKLYIICGGIFILKIIRLSGKNSSCGSQPPLQDYCCVGARAALKDVNENTTVLAAIMPNTGYWA